MVLKSLLLAALPLGSAWAQSFEPVTIENDGCKLFYINDKKKTLVPVKFKFPAGTETDGYEASGQILFGQKLSGASKPFVISHPRRPDYKFLVSGTCAFPSRFDLNESLDADLGETADSGAAEAKSAAEIPAAKSESSRRRLLLSLGPTSWRSTPSLVDPDSDRYPLNAIVGAVNLGLGWEWRGPKSDLGIWFYGFFGKGQGDLDTDTEEVEIPAELTYVARNVSSLGIAVAPLIAYRPESGSVSIGLQVPLLLNQMPWPVEDGYSVSGGNFGIGFLGDLRYERGDFFIAQKFGFMGALGQVYWALELGYTIGGGGE